MSSGILNALERPGEKLFLRSAQMGDVPRIVQWHRTLVSDIPRRADLEPQAAWFTLGGPWMDEYYCARHLRSYFDLGFDVWLVVTAGDALIGQVELWYDDEPEPFGRYGHLELLELSPAYLADDIESWLIDQAESRARERGYQRFWCRPAGSGGSHHLLRPRGYQRLWASGQVTLRGLDRCQPGAHLLSPLRGDYAAEAAQLLALNHREAAGFRWRYLWRLILDPANADWPRGTRVWARQVQFPGHAGGLCLLSIWDWHSDPFEAHVDLWVRPELSANAANTLALLGVAAKQASVLGARSLVSHLPKQLALDLSSANIESRSLDEDDAWFMKRL